LAVLGVLVVASDPLAPSDGGDPNRIPGIVASLLLLVAGYALLALAKDGPLATTGVVASALAVPPLLFFLTFDEESFPPFDIKLILGLSAALWLVTYLVGPGKGHAFYLGVGLLGLWLFLLEMIEGVFSAPFDLVSAFQFGFAPGFDPSTSPEFSEGPLPPGFGSSFGTPDLPDPDTIGGICLVLALLYLVAAFLLGRRDRDGMATPFVLAGIIIAPIGLFALADTMGNLGTGVAFTFLGLAFAAGGALTGRRWTTWFGGVLVVQGMSVIVIEAVGDDATPTTGGLALMGAGALVIVVAWVVGALLNEPLETHPGPSTFGRRPTTSSPDPAWPQVTPPRPGGPPTAF
jgi:hypothetical protein